MLHSKVVSMINRISRTIINMVIAGMVPKCNIVYVICERSITINSHYNQQTIFP